MNKEIRKLNYKNLIFNLNSESVKNFKMMESHRQISINHVKKLLTALNKGELFSDSIIINNRNGIYRIIEGNHRIEALKNFFERKENKDKIIQVNLSIFDNLSDEEEREMYSIYAEKKIESLNDRLQLYYKTLTFLELFKKDENFPCGVNIYGSKKGLRFRDILDTIKVVKSSEGKGSFVPQGLNKKDIINFANNCMYDDYLKFKKFVIFFQKVYGGIEKGNLFSKPQFFIPITDIYYKNEYKFSEKELIEGFSKIINRNKLIMYSGINSREARSQVREIIIEMMNFGRSKKLFE